MISRIFVTVLVLTAACMPIEVDGLRRKRMKLMQRKKSLKQVEFEVPAVPRNVLQRGLVKERMTYRSVLRENRFYSEETKLKHFEGETLAFVTPWNNHGYDVAKTFAAKFTYVAPVWFQVRKADNGDAIIAGEHDIDQGWIFAVRSACAGGATCPKIVPRVVWEGPGLSAEQFDRVIPMIVALCTRNHFDGIVMELPISAPIVAWVRFLNAALKAQIGESGLPLQLILVVPSTATTVRPPRTSPHPMSATPEVIHQLTPHVDRFSVMTYDFSAAAVPGGPNSPLPWIRSAIESLTSSPDEATNRAVRQKLLMGVSMYGYDVHEPITGPQYLKLLQDHRPALQWNEEAGEHYFQYQRGGSGASRLVYYPSLQFIAERIKLAQELGVGLSLWEVGQGLDYFYDLF